MLCDFIISLVSDSFFVGELLFLYHTIDRFPLFLLLANLWQCHLDILLDFLGWLERYAWGVCCFGFDGNLGVGMPGVIVARDWLCSAALPFDVGIGCHCFDSYYNFCNFLWVLL